VIRINGRAGYLTLLTVLLSISTPAITQGSSQDKAGDDPALKQFYVASGAYNRKLYLVAIGQFTEFIGKYRDHPKIDRARYGLGLSLVALKQFKKAAPHFDLLIRKGKLDQTIDRGRLVILYGQCLLFDGRKDEAKKLLVARLKTLAGGPFEASAIATITSIAYGKKDWDEVIKWADRTAAVPAATADQKARAYFQRGYAHYRKGDHKLAAASLERISSLGCLDDWKVRSLYLLGECYGVLKDHAKAEAAYAKAVPALNGADGAEARYRLGLTRFILEKYVEALADFQTYLGTTAKGRGNKKSKRSGKPGEMQVPRLAQARLYAGRCLIEIEEYDKARNQFRVLMQDKGDIGAHAHLWHARVFSRRGKYDEAAAHLANAVEKYQRSKHASDLDFDFANALMSGARTDWKKATGYFARIERRGIDKFKQMPAVLSQAAVCYHQAKDYQNSLNANNRFLARFAADDLAGDVRFMKAENLFMMGRRGEANGAYREFVGKHGDHRNAPAGVFRMAQIHHDEGRWQDSLNAARPLLDKKPTGLLYQQLAFMVGDDHFRLNHWGESVGPLEEFVAEFFDPKKRRRNRAKNAQVPNIDTALIQLAVAYNKLGAKAKALRHLVTLNTKYPYHPSKHWPLALVEQGRLAYETGDLKLAKSALDRYLSEDRRGGKQNGVFGSKRGTQLPRAQYYLGWIAHSQERYADAAGHFGASVQANRRHELAADAALQQGIAHVNAKNFEASSKHFATMIREYPAHEKRARLIYYAGLSQARLKNWRVADGHFRRLVAQHPDDENADKALYEWAWCAREMKKKKLAIQRYEMHLAKYPKSPLNLKVQSELSELNLDSDLHDQVITRLSKAMSEAKDPALVEEIRYQLANAHFKKGNHETAARMFEAMLTDYPRSKLLASIYFQAGEARFKVAETVKAREHFAKGVKIPAVPRELLEPMTMRLAEMQLQTGEFQSAARSYNKFLRDFRESQWKRNAQFGAAYAMERGGNSKRAIDHYRPLIDDRHKVDLWMVRSRYQLGECHFNLRQYEKALEYFVYVEVNYRRYPAWQAKSVLEMGRVLIAQGKRAEGQEHLKSVVKRFPKEQAAVVAGQLLDKLRRGRR
jgi:TolA-binding protein